MYFIAHRGNMIGRNVERENKEDYILECLELGYQCEIDVWIIDNEIFLGHDGPEHKTTIDFIMERKEHLWIHCKNEDALNFFVHKNVNCFYHDKDNYTITSKGIVWGNINSKCISNMICVMPENYQSELEFEELSLCIGVCSDYVLFYKQQLYQNKKCTLHISN